MKDASGLGKTTGTNDLLRREFTHGLTPEANRLMLGAFEATDHHLREDEKSEEYGSRFDFGQIGVAACGTRNGESGYETTDGRERMICPISVALKKSAADSCPEPPSLIFCRQSFCDFHRAGSSLLSLNPMSFYGNQAVASPGVQAIVSGVITAR